MTIERYTKKPVTIEATRITDGDAAYAAIAWIKASGGDAHELREQVEGRWETTGLTVYTLEGPMLARIGSYIIRGVQGEFYPCKADIFEATYDAAAEPDPTAKYAPTIAEWCRVSAPDDNHVEYEFSTGDTFVITVPDHCEPALGYHSKPHRGCILR